MLSIIEIISFIDSTAISMDSFIDDIMPEIR